MSFERLLLVLDPGLDAVPTLHAAAALAPDAREVHVLALLPDAAAAAARHGHGLAALENAQATLANWAPPDDAPGHPVDGTLETFFDVERIAETATRHAVDLVVVGPWTARSPRRRVLTLLGLTTRQKVDVLSVGARCGKSTTRAGVVALLLDAEGATVSAAVSAVRALPFAREVVAMVPRGSEGRRVEVDTALRALLPGHALSVTDVTASRASLADAVERVADEWGAELLVVPSGAASALGALVAGLFAAQALQDAARPALLLRRGAGEGALLPERLAASDALALPGVPVRVALERTSALGRVPLGVDERFAAAGADAPDDHARAHDEGVLELPAFALPDGIYERPLTLRSSREPRELASLQLVAVAPARPLLLLDAEADARALADAAPLARALTPVFVRLRAARTLDDLRARLAREAPAFASPVLIDAGAWLDDGGAPDVPRAVDSLRLMRVALRIAARGAPVSAVLVRDEHHPRSPALTTLSPADCARRALDEPPPAPLVLSPAPDAGESDDARYERALRVFASAARVGGHAVDLELDNAAARASVLAAVAGARERIHWQCYIVEDDPIAEQIALALREAAARGVAVRVLIDAVYSLHDAFGATNPVLERLARAPGVAVRAYQPVSGLPSLADLKQRNHRKTVVVDGDAAFVTGRNVGAPYYTGFAEVELAPSSSYRAVPWLDAGVRLRGPLVADVERAFLREWQRAGGDAFPVREQEPAGAADCRLVLHEGLVDTHTLELQLAMAARARERLVVVNTFPFVVELQRALIAAVRRGVRVQVLFGSVRPRWGDDQPFEGSVLRALGDELVRSRIDPIVRAGGEGYELALAPAARWDPALAPVYPHVHAKVIVRDEVDVAIGSANVDVTSAFWESEAVLLVHDAGFARATSAALAPLLASARRVDPSAGPWQRGAQRRAWLGRNWPSLVG